MARTLSRSAMVPQTAADGGGGSARPAAAGAGRAAGVLAGW